MDGLLRMIFTRISVQVEISQPLLLITLWVTYFSCILCVTITEQQRIYSQWRPALRQRKSSSISSKNSNIASVCWYVFSQGTFSIFIYVFGLTVLHSKYLYLYRYRPVWNQPSPILHQRSLSTMYSNLWIWWVSGLMSTSQPAGLVGGNTCCGCCC